MGAADERLQGTGYTTTRLGDEPRTNNIRISAQNLNGNVIYPGETASTLKMFHDVTEENGYQMGLGYIQNRLGR